MSAISSDLEQFLEVVGKVSAVGRRGSGRRRRRLGRRSRAPACPRSRATQLTNPTPCSGLTHTVRVAAESSPSLAYVLAARYTADLTISDEGRPRRRPSPWRPVHSRSRGRDVARSRTSSLVLDVDELKYARRRRGTRSKDSAEVEPRTGLAAARQASFVVPAHAAERSAVGRATRPDRLGPPRRRCPCRHRRARRPRDATRTCLERRQFGVPIGSFAGLRALVAEMQLRVEPLRALLDLRGGRIRRRARASRRWPAPAAVANCLDAIQAHGGYGYIDEYPVADLLRDAVSLQARAGGRRLHVARVALRGLGAPAEQPLMTPATRRAASRSAPRRSCGRERRWSTRSERPSCRGEFSQGDKLPPETELAQQFGVSRPTVREALGSLVAAGSDPQDPRSRRRQLRQQRHPGLAELRCSASRWTRSCGWGRSTSTS